MTFKAEKEGKFLLLKMLYLQLTSTTSLVCTIKTATNAKVPQQSLQNI